MVFRTHSKDNKKKVRHQKVLECDEFGISGAFEIIGKAENKVGAVDGG
ncbi:MAG: hypothetical protein U9N07_09560 [Euryarchaeota archaeon]|nr:hypothetical protein [Euryarchaeota archaeon]